MTTPTAALAADQSALATRVRAVAARHRSLVTGALHPKAALVRAIARVADVEHHIERVNSGRRATYVWLHVGTPDEVRDLLADALRWAWLDSAVRVHELVTGVGIGRDHDVRTMTTLARHGLPKLPFDTDFDAAGRLDTEAWAHLVHARVALDGALYLAPDELVRQLVEAGLAEVPAETEALGWPYNAHGEVLTDRGRRLVGAAVRRVFGLTEDEAEQ
jgi:hypothetical protein